MRQIILASTSPRRRELMEFLGVPFDVTDSLFPEEDVSRDDFDEASDYVSTLALGKAVLAAQQYNDALVIGADTIVWLDNKLIGKPKDLDDARRILQTLRGRDHEVYTGLCVLDTLTGDQKLEVVHSTVSFFPFSDEELERYISTSESLGKAGAYAIQGGAKNLVRAVQGSVSNVVGLPLLAITELLEAFDIPIDVDIRRVEAEHFSHAGKGSR